VHGGGERMSFKQWRRKAKEASEYCTEHEHLGGSINSYRRMDCEECIWNIAYEKGIYEQFEALWDFYVKCRKSKLTEGAIKLRILLQKIKKEALKHESVKILP
jgi:hypothetical protein